MNTLQAKIQARNTANKLANDVFPAIVESLRPFVGQKICNVDGTLLQKVRDAIPKAPNNHPNLHSFYTTGHGYYLLLNIKVCVVLNQQTHYADVDLYVAKVSNGVLESFYDAQNFRSDYTEMEILEARNEVTNARKTLRNAESKIFFFGEHDN